MFLIDPYSGEPQPPIVFDTAAGFTGTNRILLPGQFGTETDTKRFKIGDGSTAWNSLAYNDSTRVQTITTASTITVNTDLYDDVVVTALASNAAIAAPTGTPTTRKKILYHIRDNGTPWTLTPNAIFRDLFGQVSSWTTTAGKWFLMGVEWNVEDSTWDIISAATQQ